MSSVAISWRSTTLLSSTLCTSIFPNTVLRFIEIAHYARYGDINEIKNIFITNINGLPVLVKDVADVQISGLPRLGEVEDRTQSIVAKRVQYLMTMTQSKLLYL